MIHRITKKCLLLAILSVLAFPDKNVCNDPINIAIAKQQIIEYYESGVCEKEYAAIINDAIDYLEHNKHSFGENKTIIFDVDGTALDAFAYVKQTDFCCHCGPKDWEAFLLRAEFPAYKPVLKFYRYCIDNRFHVIFLTNREENHYDATVENLLKQGYTTFDRVICRPPRHFSVHSRNYKLTCRKKLVEEGFNIVASIGDQPADVTGDYVGYAIKLPCYCL